MRNVFPLALLLCLSAAFAQNAGTFRDDFSAYPADSDGSPAWETDSVGWSVAPPGQGTGGRLRAECGGRSFAVFAKSPRGRVQIIEATLSVSSTLNGNWKTAGLAVYRDDANYWHLALVESPDADGSKHFIELQESYAGQWLATSGETTRLTMVENQGYAWENNHPYRLRIELGQDMIRGTVSELDGTLRGRIAYKLDNPKLVNAGSAALDCAGFVADFSDFRVDVAQAAPPAPPKAKAVFPPFTAKGISAIAEKPTGYFRVKQINGRWWLITPKGEGFYAVGTDHASYNAHWCEKLGYAPYHKNCEAKYGGEEPWALSTAQRLKDWNFNALGCGWSPGMKGKGLPRDEFVSFGSAFAKTDNIAQPINWTGFPNVFSPKWPTYCDKRAKAYCGALKADPWIIGYFLDNELEWFGKNGKPWGLFDEAMKKPADHTAKVAVVEFLKAKYPSIADFNTAWKTSFADWNAVSAAEALVSVTPEADRDRLGFIALIAEKYFSITNAAMKKYDPNHLNLGCRFAGITPPGAIEICGKYCDIVSVNYYGHVDLQRQVSTDMPKIFADYAARCKRPMMITEWSFPAYDSGLPCLHGAGQRVATQAEKALAYKVYQTALMSFPFMVGSNYFMWVDEPALGISSTFPEDSNYGLVDVDDQPWRELTQMATTVNRRVYEIHSGRTPEVAVAIAADGKSVTVSNSGGSAAQFNLHLWTDGKESVAPLKLAAGAKTKQVFAAASAPGGHLVAAQADPEEKLAQTDRSRNLAWRTVYVPGAKWAAAGTSRYPLIVSNPSSQPATQVRFSRLLAEVAPKAGAVKAWALVDASGKPVKLQVDGEGKYAELAFDAGEIAAYSCRTFYLQPASAMEALAPAMAAQVTQDAFAVDTGALKLEHASGSPQIISAVSAGDLALGRFGAVMHQQLAQQLWTSPDKTETIQCNNGPVRFTADVVVACTTGGGDTKTVAGQEGGYAPQQSRPHRYRACYRICAYPGAAWFTSRLLWVENADAEPWQLAAYFDYAVSNIAGDAANDEPAKTLPSDTVAWTNPTHGGAYGFINTNPDDFKANFWKDAVPNGSEHPDVRREVNVALKPGQRYDAPQPAALFFGCKTLDEVKPMVSQVRAQSQAQIQVLAAEKR